MVLEKKNFFYNKIAVFKTFCNAIFTVKHYKFHKLRKI